MFSSLTGHPKSILFFDQPDRLEFFIRSGILTFPCMMSFFSGKRADALARIERQEPDILVSSLIRPDGTAIDLLTDLKASARGLIPSIFIGVAEGDITPAQVLKFGAFDVHEDATAIPELLKKVGLAVQGSDEFMSKMKAQSPGGKKDLRADHDLKPPLKEVVDEKKAAISKGE